MKLTNLDMEQKIESLAPLLDRRDKVGYAAARNTRMFTDASLEYARRKEELIMAYGTPELDENGNETGRRFIFMSSPEYDRYLEEIGEYAEIEHEVDVFTLPFSEVEGVLSGNEILMIDWMLEE